MKKSMDLTTGNLFKKILTYTIPIILTSLLNLLYNACDVIVVGQFSGDEALAAVGSTSSLINLIVGLFSGLALGGSVAYGRSIGMKDYERANNTVHTSFIASIITGFVLMIIGILFSKEFLKWMDSPDDVIDLAALYMKIYFSGMIFNFAFNFLCAIMRAGGDTKRPLIILSIAGLLNVVLNLVFVIIFNLSVAGVAIATVASQLFSLIAIIYIMVKEKGPLNFSFHKLKIDKDVLKEIIVIGLPSGIQASLFSISNVIIQSSINSFGTTVIAANAAVCNIEGFVCAIMSSFSQAALNFTSTNYGAKKFKNIKKTCTYSLLYACILGELAGLIGFLFSKELMSLYTKDPNVIEIGLIRFKYLMALYALCGFQDVMASMLRGLGYSLSPMFSSIFGICVFRIIWIKTVFKANPTLDILYSSYPISWVLVSIVSFIFFIISLKIVKRKFENDISYN